MTEQNPEDQTPPEEPTTDEQPPAGTTDSQPEETAPEAPASDEPTGERVKRLGVEYDVTPERGHRQVR